MPFHRLLGKVTFVRDIGATIETTVECSGVTFTALSTPCLGFGLSIGNPVSIPCRLRLAAYSAPKKTTAL